MTKTLCFSRRLGLAVFGILALGALSACLPLQFGVEGGPTASPAATQLAQMTNTLAATADPATATETPGLFTPAFGVTVTPSPTGSASMTPSEMLSTPTPPPSETPRPTSVECALTHVVQPGERLSQIGAFYGVRWQDIAALNNLADPGLIFAGQVLCLPPGARPPTATRTPTAAATLTAAPSATATTGNATAIADLCQASPPPPWFFTPTPPVCPTAAAVTSQAAAQRFEGGQMLWLGVNDLYYVLFEGATASTRHMLPLSGPLNFKPGASPDNRVPETPPPGLDQPVSGFGLIWRGEVVGSEGVRQALGWATESEFAFSAQFQCQASVTVEWNCYLRAPSGQLLRLYYAPGAGYLWDNWP